MMDNLRAAGNHVVLKIILALVILSFVLTGVGGYMSGSSNDFAAKVNDQEITRAQLEQAVQGERSRLQQQLGEQFSMLAGNDGYMQQLREQVLAQLINNVLIEQYAHELGLIVSDEQVKESIRQAPYLQTDNKFDNDKYKNVVQRMGYTLEQFAELHRQLLINQQLLQFFVNTGLTLPTEVQATSELILQQRDIRLAIIDIKVLQTQQKVSDEELKTYYEQNKNSFIAPEKLKVNYIEIDATAMQDKITVSDKDINHYYAQHKGVYTQPERKNYSVIQLGTKAESQSVLDALKKGADFAAVAKEKSTDVISRKNGGELGWLEPETTPDELKQANLKMKGELSGVIKSSLGYLIVRLNDVKPEQEKPLTELRAEIEEQVKQEKSANAYYALQQKLSEAAINDNTSLASAEEVAGVKAKMTDWFTRSTVPAALNFKPILDALFDGSMKGEEGVTGINSDVITVEGDRAFVLRVSEREKEAIQPLTQVQQEVSERVKRQKALQQARVEGERLLVALKQGTGSEALKAAGLSFGSSKKLSRAPDDQPWIQIAFSLPHPQKEKPVYGLSQDRQGNFVLIELQSIVQGHLPKDELQPFVSRMKESANNVTFNSLMENLRRKATIKLGVVEQGL